MTLSVRRDRGGVQTKQTVWHHLPSTKQIEVLRASATAPRGRSAAIANAASRDRAPGTRRLNARHRPRADIQAACPLNASELHVITGKDLLGWAMTWMPPCSLFSLHIHDILGTKRIETRATIAAFSNVSDVAYPG